MPRAQLEWVNSARNSEPFPAKLPWQEFVEERVTIEELRERAPLHYSILDRSFASNPSTPVLPKSELRKLFAEHAKFISEPARSELRRDLHAIGLWFLMPFARRAVDADLDATRGYLKDLKRLSRGIEKPLLHVLALMHLSVSEELEQDPTWRRSGAEFDVMALRQFVRALPGVSDRLALKVEAQRKGRRSNFILDHSVGLASAAFKRAKRPVQGRAATFDMQPRLIGDGADLFLAFFKMLDQSLAENALSMALRRSLRNGKTQI